MKKCETDMLNASVFKFHDHHIGGGKHFIIWGPRTFKRKWKGNLRSIKAYWREACCLMSERLVSIAAHGFSNRIMTQNTHLCCYCQIATHGAINSFDLASGHTTSLTLTRPRLIIAGCRQEMAEVVREVAQKRKEARQHGNSLRACRTARHSASLCRRF